MIAEKLRKSILQAAIQGKLTEQLPDDGDARELLTKIKAEKVKLIAEGKIKKEKPLPEISDDEIPFDIPDNWCWVRFGEIFSIGSSKRVHQKDWRTSGIPFYRAREIAKLADQGFVYNELFIDNEFFGQLKNESGAPRVGDLMVTGVGTLGKTYIVKETDEFYYKDASVLCVTNYGNIIPEYFKYFMETSFMMDQINSNSSGTTVATLTISRYNEYLFSLPPLAEQQRIVEAIEKAFEKIKDLEKDELKLNLLQKSFPKKMKDSLLQSAIQGKLTEQLESDGNALDLVAEIQKEKEQLVKEGKIKKEKALPDITDDEVPFDIPDNWCWVRVNKLTLSISAGGDKPKDFLENKTDTHMVPVIANGIQNEGIIGYTQKATITEPCITISGRGTIGFSCVRTEPFMPIVRLLVLNVSNKVIKKYIQFVFNLLLEKGVGTSIPQLTVPMLEPKLIPLPPLAEQQRIVERLEQLLPLCDTLE